MMMVGLGTLLLVMLFLYFCYVLKFLLGRQSRKLAPLAVFAHVDILSGTVPTATHFQRVTSSPTGSDP